jgi:hypothetical protein
MDLDVQHYYRKTKDGKVSGRGTKTTYFKKGTKEGFTVKVMYDFIGHTDEYIKDGVVVIYIQ